MRAQFRHRRPRRRSSLERTAKPSATRPLAPKDAVIPFADLQSGIVERLQAIDVARMRKAVGAVAKLTMLFDITIVDTTAPVGGTSELLPD